MCAAKAAPEFLQEPADNHPDDMSNDKGSRRSERSSASLPAVGRLAWLLSIFLPLPLQAQVASFADVTGHAFGERITQHHEMVRYLEHLAAASPRVEVRDQGESWEGRKLLVAIVTSPENHARLGQIQANAQRLADPRNTLPDEAASVIRNQPAIVWFGGSIHGFELSGSEGILKLLEHLATRDDAETLEVLQNTIVFIDPMLNPDGRDAFANRNHESIGRLPNAERDDWSNDFTSWEGVKFRTGHYFFDNNRDWFAQTQPETRARARTMREWRPQAIIDMHEMGPDQEFFFYPGTPPISPHVPEFALRWIERFANAYAAAFDSAGFAYMTREAFDYFYPGYTDTYGSFLGAAGMLYEQGSSRGLALTRSDRSVRTLAEALEQEYTAARTAARFAATHREEMLQQYYDGIAQAIAAGRSGIRRYLIPPEGDPGLHSELANVLIRSGVEVGTMTASAELNGVRDRGGQDVGRRTFPAGTYVIETAQPRAHLIRTLLEPNTPVSQAFLDEARARVDRGERAEFYDITAWSLPLLFNLGGYSSSDARTLQLEQAQSPVRPEGAGVVARATYAYLIDGRQAGAVAALYHLVAGGHRAAMTMKPTRIAARDIPSGTVVVRIGNNDESVHAAVRELAERYALAVRPTGTGLAEGRFPSLGSADVVSIKKPEIAILAEDPVQGYSFGWAWYTLDQAYGIPSTVLRVRSVADTPIDRFDVLVIPATSATRLSEAVGDTGLARIRRWVREGGTLVVLGSAIEFARDSSALDLIALRAWSDTPEGDSAQAFDVPGAILRGRLDREYWLSAGYQGQELPVLVNGTRIYLQPEGPPSARRRVVVRLAATDSIRISGHAWPESLDRLGGAVFAYEERVEERVGSGRVIAFAEDPNYRGFWRGANRLFLNAVVVGPSAP
jgi:hypothetical protein